MFNSKKYKEKKNLMKIIIFSYFLFNMKNIKKIKYNYIHLEIYVF